MEITHGRNTKEALYFWANEALEASELPADTKATLLALAHAEIDKDGLRGDVSAIWIDLGHDMTDIPDMYP